LRFVSCIARVLCYCTVTLAHNVHSHLRVLCYLHLHACTQCSLSHSCPLLPAPSRLHTMFTLTFVSSVTCTFTLAHNVHSHLRVLCYLHLHACTQCSLSHSCPLLPAPSRLHTMFTLTFVSSVTCTFTLAHNVHSHLRVLCYLHLHACTQCSLLPSCLQTRTTPGTRQPTRLSVPGQRFLRVDWRRVWLARRQQPFHSIRDGDAAPVRVPTTSCLFVST
jgi:hypothetical protein